jgi:hypothetical protein
VNHEGVYPRVDGAREEIAIHVGQATQAGWADGIDDKQQPYQAHISIEVCTQLITLIIQHRVRRSRRVGGRVIAACTARCRQKSDDHDSRR